MADTKISQDYSTNPFTWDGTEVLPGIKGGANGAGLVSNLATFIAGDKVTGPGSAVAGHLAVFSGTTGKLVADGGAAPTGTNTGDQTITLTGDVTGSGTGSFAATLAARSTDGTMAANSATLVPSQSAVVAYVAMRQDGRSWKQVARAATTANGTLATAFANGSVIDGVTLATGDRILLKNQTTGAENGLYTVNASGAPTRSTDADTGTELVNATVEVSEGTANADTQWSQTANAPITVGTTALVWVNISTATTYTADETTLHLAGNQFSLKAGAVAIDTHAATGKTTPVDADEMPVVDSAASNVLKKLTWANLKATLKTYFDTLYGSGSGSVTTVSVVTANGVSGSVANASTTPAITLSLAAITPTTVVASSTVTGTAFLPTGSGVPADGLYLPAADTLGLATASTERVRVSATGNMVLGGTPAISTRLSTTVTTPQFQVHGMTGATSSNFNARWANDSSAAGLYIGKSRGGAIGTHGAVANNDILGYLSFAGSDGTNFVEGARIQINVDGTPGADNTPGRISFQTTNTTATPIERVRIDSTGSVIVGGGGAIATRFGVVTVTPALQVHGLTGSTVSNFNARWANDGSGVALYMGKSRSGTIGTHVAVNASDTLGQLSFAGSDGTNFVESVRISAFVDGTPGADNTPGGIIFATASTTNTPVERLRLSHLGAIGIGGATYGNAGDVLTSGGASAPPTWSAAPFDITAFYPGVPSASAKVARIPVARAVALPANFAGSYFTASANATATTVFDVQKNGSSIGSVSIAAGGTTATFTTTSGTSKTLAAGDVFAVIAPATPDATLADPGFVFAGTR